MTVLSIAGIAGLSLGILGWTQRGTGLVAPLVSTSASPSSANSPSAGASPSAATSGSASPSVAAGPALSSQPYASFAYQVWPGPLTATAKITLTGWKLTVTRQAGGIAVKAAQDGQAMTGASHFFPGGAKVYVLDSTLGDDAGGNVDYNQTDDGLVVTNAQGQVLP
jgi:hypothetical protein